MTCNSGDGAQDWHYAPPRSLLGALQRGRGLAVARLRGRPENARLVYECIGRDTRWDWRVDGRCEYLARLVRDLRLDLAPLVAQLRACGPRRPWPQPDPTDDDNQFDLVVGVMAVLARGGNEQAREALRAYVSDGVRWSDALSTLADRWPVAWWDDLWERAAERIGAEDAADLWPAEQPWRGWRGRDARLDAVFDAVVRRRPAAGAPRSDLSTASDAQLLAFLEATSSDTGALNLALGRIRHRGRPVPELLELAERLAPVRPAGLFGALRTVGLQVAPKPRDWAADSDHPLFRDAPDLLGEHSDQRDIPLLLAALDQLDDWCGYDMLTERLARILAGSPPAPHADSERSLVRRLRWLAAVSPHSYERASYLCSLLLLDTEHTTAILPIHLLDCEPEVRLLAVRHTPLTDDARRWLAELRDDPIEEDRIRSAASERLPAR